MNGFKRDSTGYWKNVPPQAYLDYDINAADFLPTGDTISTVVWTVPAGLTVEAQSATSTVAKVWLSGFTDGETYEVSAKITSANSRVVTVYFRLICKEAWF